MGLALVEIWHGTLVDPTDVVFLLSLAIPPYAFGRIARRMAEQSEQLVRQQAQLRDQAVQEERDRIARDLHDVLAHSLSSMVVQTAAAQDLVRTDPDRAEDLLTSAAETGRAALDETGRLLHLVRGDSGEQPGLAPAPGLSEVGDLVAAARLTGLDVEAELDLPERPLPGAVDVFGYRVVQEALTNATRYADGRARLEVSSTATGLRICCSNPVSTAHGPAGSGLGLQGVAERVELLGGTLSTRHGDGTHTLDVEIPLPGTAPS